MAINQFPENRTNFIKALDTAVNFGEKLLNKVQLTATEIKSRKAFIEQLAPQGFKFLAAGAEKIVLARNQIPPSNQNEPAKVYYIPMSTYFLSKGNSLKNEKTKMDEMKSKIGEDNIQNLLLDAKEIKGKDRIQGHYTLEVDAATGGNFEKAMRKPDTTIQTRAKFGGDFLKGLSQLHGADYAYGDLKPENCLIFHDKDGSPFLKIADFGKADQIKQGEDGKMQPGNLRFSAPEAKFSKENDIWGAAIILIRNLEEAVLSETGEPLLEVQAKDQEEVPAMESRRGIEQFIVNHKAFIGMDEPHFTDKVGRRLPRLLNPEKFPAQKQSDLISNYVDALTEKLVAQNKLEPKQAQELNSLLKIMTSANPADRPATKVASNIYNEIFNLS